MLGCLRHKIHVSGEIRWKRIILYLRTIQFIQKKIKLELWSKIWIRDGLVRNNSPHFANSLAYRTGKRVRDMKISCGATLIWTDHTEPHNQILQLQTVYMNDHCHYNHWHHHHC